MKGMNDKIILTSNNMPPYFRQTKEYIFLDSIEVEPGIKATGTKFVTENEWYFQYHFPNNPVMPGVFQMEIMMQAGGLIINTLTGKKELALMFSECKNARIYQSVRPNTLCEVEVELSSYKRGIAWFHGCITANGKIACKMQFSLIAPDEILSIGKERT